MDAVLTCPSCGATNVQHGDRYCPRCGASLFAATAAAYAPTVLARSPAPTSTPRGRGRLRVAVVAVVAFLACFAIGTAAVYALTRGPLGTLLAVGAPPPTATATPRPAATTPARPILAPARAPSAPTIGPTDTIAPAETPTDAPTGTPEPTATAPDIPTATSVPTAPPDSATSSGAGSGTDTAAQDVHAAVVRSNTAWATSLVGATNAGLESVKTDDSLKQTLAQVATLRQQGQHWDIRLHRLDTPWIHVFRPDYAQALERKDEYRALWDNGASSPAQVSDTPYFNLIGLRRVDGRWLVSTIDTPNATPGTPGDTGADQGDPTDAVRAFYDDISAHDDAAAYGLYSDDLQSRVPDEATWARQFDGEQDARPSNLRVVYRDPATALVSLHLTSVWTTGAGGQDTYTSDGSWLLHVEHGGWRLDHVVISRAQ